MEFQDSEQDAKFRANVRKWLSQHAPAHELQAGQTPSDAEIVERGKSWQREVYDGGWAGLTVPESLGGRGGAIAEALIFEEEEARYNLPKGPYMGIGLGMAIPVIVEHGSAELIKHFVEPTLRGELVWCQLFSEPNAGSDLAAVRTKAVHEGDEWVINGQKVWSSWAHESDWGLLIARTDPALPKHKGLTFFLLDMTEPGIDIRPIRQISGASDFNEVFLTDVRISDKFRVGETGAGWSCCMTVLTSERLNESDDGKVSEVIRHFGEADPAAIRSSGAQMELAKALAEEHAERFFIARLKSMISRGENPGALSSIVKLSYASRLQRVSALALEAHGLDSIAVSSDAPEIKAFWDDYIWSSALRIAGGADEVLRNQIAERILGMPGDYRPDKDLPFKDIS